MKCTGSPIIFDMAGDGVHLTSAADGVVFPLQGEYAQWSWTEVGTDDAWLVMDRNHNGLIDNGHEMFGDVTAQGEVMTETGSLRLQSSTTMPTGR